jgi:hypothetical protein
MYRTFSSPKKSSIPGRNSVDRNAAHMWRNSNKKTPAKTGPFGSCVPVVQLPYLFVLEQVQISLNRIVCAVHRLNMEFIWASCAQLGRYWSAKIDDISM